MPNFQPYVTGPTPLFASQSGSSTPRLLGTCEGGVQIKPSIVAYDAVGNDIGGSMLSVDDTYQGEEWSVSGVLTVFDWAILEMLAARPFTSSTPGTSIFGEIGTLMIAEGAYPQLWALFPYATKAYQSSSIVAGYHFFAAKFLGPELTGSTKAQRSPVAFECKRKIQAGGIFKTYDHSMTGCTFPV